MKEGIPYTNGAPNLSGDFPAMVELATDAGMPICGLDTILQPRLYPQLYLMKLKNNLWHLMGEDLITHLGTECYD